MLANIYDRLHFILEKTKGIEARLDLLERSKGKSRGKELNTLYGERKKGLGVWLKGHVKIKRSRV